MKLLRAAFLYKIIQNIYEIHERPQLTPKLFPFFSAIFRRDIKLYSSITFELFTSLWRRTRVTEGTYPGNCKAIVFKQSLEP